jgi:hypothetical protein
MSEYTKLTLKEKVSQNPFPVTNVDPKQKEKDGFGKKVAQNIYYKGLLKDLSSNRRNIAEENRAFGSNRQDINKYKGLLDAEIDKEGNKSYMNIDWSIQAPGKKFVDTLVGDMSNQDYKIQFNAIDKHSKAKLKKDRDNFYGQVVKERDIAEMEEASGLVLDERTKFKPRDREEVDIYMELDYKQAIEIGMEQIVDFELYNNDWDRVVKNRVIRDLVENAIGGARLYFDRNNQIRLRYVDAPTNYYTSETDEPDHDDTEYQAERKMMSIRALRDRDAGGKIKESEWFKIARQSSGKFGNQAWKFGETYDVSGSYNGIDYAYDDYRIEILDFIFYTNDRYVWTEQEDKYGNNHTSRKSFDYKKPQRSKKKIDLIEKDIEMSYEGIWVVGADIMINYGRTKNIVRPYNKKGDKISSKILRRYVIFQPNLRNGASESIVDVMKPNLETIQLLVLRKRHVIAEMTPTGVAIDASGITDVLDLIGETDPMRIVKLYKQKGVLFFTRTDVNGDPANGLPIQQLNNPFAEQLMALDSAIISEIEMIRQNTGINDARDGSSPDKDALVGIEKMRLLASNNTTRELYQAFTDGIFSQVGKVMARMIQYKVEYGDGIEEYENIVGELGVKSVEFAKDITMAQLGIKVEALPTDDQIQDVLNMLEISLKNKEIRPEDYLEVKRVNNVKKAERLLIFRRRKYAEEQMAEFQQREEITGQREQQAAMAAAEAEKVKNQSSAEAKVATDSNEYRLKKEYSDHETMNEIKKIDREYWWKQKLIKEQEQGGKDDAGSKFGIDKPRTNINPGGAAVRQTNITP